MDHALDEGIPLYPGADLGLQFAAQHLQSRRPTVPQEGMCKLGGLGQFAHAQTSREPDPQAILVDFQVEFPERTVALDGEVGPDGCIQATDQRKLRADAVKSQAKVSLLNADHTKGAQIRPPADLPLQRG